MSITIALIQNQISNLQNSVTSFNSCITAIDASSPVGAELIAAVANHRAHLVMEISAFETQITSLQAELASVEAMWTSGQQTIVNQINTTFTGSSSYATNMDSLMFAGSTAQSQFFTPYCQANTTFLQEIVIRNYFNL